MLSPTLLATELDVRGILLRRPHLWCLLEAEIQLEHQRCLHRFPPLSESSIPNATILSVTCLRKWIAQNSTNKMTHLPLNAKEIAVSPSVLSARRFFSLGSWSTRKSTSSLKENVFFSWWTSWGPTITGCFPLCLFTSSRCSYWVAVTLKGPMSNVRSTWNTEKCLGFVQNLVIIWNLIYYYYYYCWIQSDSTDVSLYNRNYKL